MINYYYDLPNDIIDKIENKVKEIELFEEAKKDWIYNIIDLNEYFKEIEFIIYIEEFDTRPYRSIEKYLLETGWASDKDEDNYITEEQIKLKNRIYGIDIYC
jgi:hypothetical protein